MKKSIIILGIIFIVGVIGWSTSPRAFVNNGMQVRSFVPGQNIPISELNNDGNERTIVNKVSSRSQEQALKKDAQNKSTELSRTSQILDSFKSPDSSYRSAGQLVLRTEEDRQFLDFQNFSVSNGPDLFVTLNKKSNPNSGSLGSHIKLGRLESISGRQSYDISNIDLDDYESLAVYCNRFSKVFAVAQL